MQKHAKACEPCKLPVKSMQAAKLKLKAVDAVDGCIASYKLQATSHKLQMRAAKLKLTAVDAVDGRLEIDARSGSANPVVERWVVTDRHLRVNANL